MKKPPPHKPYQKTSHKKAKPTPTASQARGKIESKLADGGLKIKPNSCESCFEFATIPGGFSGRV